METKDISAALKRRIKKSMKFDKLLNILNHLEEYGFIKRDIISAKNRPKLIWKTKY